MPTISTLTIDTQVKTSGLQRGLNIASGAILAVGAIATKMALDYDDAFTKIAAVSNASAADVEKWKGQVLDLAGKTAQAPKELADALYFLASAGLKANQIMPVLEASAKASAAGLGETADVAHLTANVLNAYAGSGLKAAKVTDILVSAVKAGSADTDEFGTAIGRVLPIASKAGIGFDSVAASLASLSNIGLDVNEGVTAMRGLFQALIAPTGAAAQTMKTIGLSSQDLLDSLQKDGLIATLRLLDTAVKQNTTGGAEYMSMLRTIVPNVRALTGMLGLTTQQAEGVDAIFKQVRNSTGELDTAFKTTAESAGFKFRQALAELQVAAINIGNMIIPVLVDIVGWIEKLADWFSKLPEPMQNFAKIALAVGAGLILLAKAVTIVEGTVKALSVVLSINPYVLIIAATIALAIIIVKNWDTIKAFLIRAWDAILDAAKWAWDHLAIFILGPMKLVIDFLIDHWRGFAEFFKAAWDRISGIVKTAVGFIVADVKMIVDAIMDVVHAVQTAISWLDKMKGAASIAAGAPGLGGGGVAQFVPKAQHGGEVLRTGLALVHKGEVFSGVGNEMGFGGLTVNIYGDVTGEEVVRKVRDGLLKLKARNATTGL
jgi:TP901 family phage tail tape measure protein